MENADIAERSLIGASEWTRTIDPHHVKVVL